MPSDCPRCHGMGETLVASYAVGGGCFNDEWDICHACGGTGTATTQQPTEKVEEAA